MLTLRRVEMRVDVDGGHDVRPDRGGRQVDHRDCRCCASTAVVVHVRAGRRRVEHDADLVEVRQLEQPSTPVVGRRRRPSAAARARPSDAGSMPTIAPISSVCDRRMTLIIRSVPILPEPMIATLSRGHAVILLRESDRDLAEPADLRLDDVARRDADHRPKRARQHDVAGAQRSPRSRDRARQPEPRRAADGRGRPAPRRRDDRLAVDAHRHAARRRGRARSSGSRSPDTHVEADDPLSATVSANDDLPVGDAAVDDLDRGHRARHGRATSATSASAPSRSAASRNATSASTFGCSSDARGHRAAVRHDHVVEQHAEVGLIDAELRLHRLRVSPILRPTAHRTALAPAGHVDRGDGVRRLHVVRSDEVAHGRARGAPLRGRPETVGRGLPRIGGGGHAPQHGRVAA